MILRSILNRPSLATVVITTVQQPLLIGFTHGTMNVLDASKIYDS